MNTNRILFQRYSASNGLRGLGWVQRCHVGHGKPISVDGLFMGMSHVRRKPFGIRFQMLFQDAFWRLLSVPPGFGSMQDRPVKVNSPPGSGPPNGEVLLYLYPTTRVEAPNGFFNRRFPSVISTGLF